MKIIFGISTYLILSIFLPYGATAQNLVGGRWYIDKMEFVSNSFSNVLYERDSLNNVTDFSMISSCFLADSTLLGSAVSGKYLEGEYSYEGDSLSEFGAPKSKIEWINSNQFVLSFDGNFPDTTFQPVFGTMYTTLKRNSTNCDCSSIFVNTTSPDDIQGSLKNLVQSSCDDQIIRFDVSLDGQPIIFDSLDDEIEIISDLRIRGNGQTKTIIDGGSVSRIFIIYPGARLWLYDLTLRNSKANDNGGAILNEGKLVLENVTFENNFEGALAKSFTNIGDGEVIVYPATSAKMK